MEKNSRILFGVFVILAMLFMYSSNISNNATKIESEVIRYVRFVKDNIVSYGIHDGNTIYQLSDAPYNNGSLTGKVFKTKNIFQVLLT